MNLEMNKAASGLSHTNGLCGGGDVGDEDAAGAERREQIRARCGRKQPETTVAAGFTAAAGLCD